MTDFEAARFNMVESQVHPADVTDPRILSIMGEIPREQFVPASVRPVAYIDEDVTIRPAGQTSAARYLMEPMPFARLVQLAAVKDSDLVLDVGCGMGYSAAVLARLADSVVALESDEALAETATQRLQEQNIDNVAVVTGPLPEGNAKQGPYDVIFINGSLEEVPAALLDQLAEGGRLVAVIDKGPVGKAHLFVRHGEVTSSRFAFDASVRPLPGFEREREFSF